MTTEMDSKLKLLKHFIGEEIYTPPSSFYISLADADGAEKTERIPVKLTANSLTGRARAYLTENAVFEKSKEEYTARYAYLFDSTEASSPVYKLTLYSGGRVTANTVVVLEKDRDLIELY